MRLLYPSNDAPESVIQRQILQWLHLQRIFCWRNHSTGIYDAKRKTFRTLNGYGDQKGVSDILGVAYGKPLAIEVKSRTGKLSKFQQEFLRAFAESGGIAIVARSIEDVSLHLEKYKPTQA